MNRTPMKRGKPLRSNKAQIRALKPDRSEEFASHQVKPTRATMLRRDDGKARLVVPVPKRNPLQHLGYMRLVRALPCALCGVSGYSQFAHSDESKGMAIKSDCRLGWPGCGPHHDSTGQLVNGCHYMVGTSGTMPKEKRRAFEAAAAARTRTAIIAAGKWPATLPLWPETT